MRATIYFFLAALLLSGCAGLFDPDLPTPMPTEYLPTAIALTVAAQGILAPPAPANASTPDTATPLPLPTATPAPAGMTPLASDTRRPADTATLTPTLLPTALSPSPTAPAEIPFAAVQILGPGPASRVISPFNLHTFLYTGPKGLVQLALFGEDGRVLLREVKSYGGALNQLLHIGQEIEFEIPGVAETGTLQVSVEDDHGRLMALNSLELILLSVGDSDIFPAGDQLEAIYIQEPRPKALIQGGSLRVAGLARLHSDLPILIEIKTDSGAIAGTRQVAVEPPAEGGYGSFAIDVTYAVSAPTAARVIVWERTAKNISCQESYNACILHLSSVEVMISP